MTSSAPLAFDCTNRLTALLVIGSIRLLALCLGMFDQPIFRQSYHSYDSPTDNQMLTEQTDIKGRAAPAGSAHGNQCELHSY